MNRKQINKKVVIEELIHGHSLCYYYDCPINIYLNYSYKYDFQEDDIDYGDDDFYIELVKIDRRKKIISWFIDENNDNIIENIVTQDVRDRILQRWQ
jgi:hypothetical protein